MYVKQLLSRSFWIICEKWDGGYIAHPAGILRRVRSVGKVLPRNARICPHSAPYASQPSQVPSPTPESFILDVTQTNEQAGAISTPLHTINRTGKTMEFDIEAFAADVTAALRYQSPSCEHLRGVEKRRTPEPHRHGSRGREGEGKGEGKGEGRREESDSINHELGTDNLFESYKADVVSVLQIDTTASGSRGGNGSTKRGPEYYSSASVDSRSRDGGEEEGTVREVDGDVDVQSRYKRRRLSPCHGDRGLDDRTATGLDQDQGRVQGRDVVYEDATAAEDESDSDSDLNDDLGVFLHPGA